MKHFLLIAICILFFGISMFFRKLAVDKVHPYQVQAMAGLLYVALVPMWLTLAGREHATSYPTSGIVYGLLCTVLYLIGAVLLGFLLKGSKNVGVIAALVSLSPVVTLTLSMYFLHEKFTPAKIVAFLLALASAILVNF